MKLECFRGVEAGRSGGVEKPGGCMGKLNWCGLAVTQRYWAVKILEGKEQRGRRDTLLVVECNWRTDREPHVCGLASPPLSCRCFWVVTWSLGSSTSEPSGKGFLTDIPSILSPSVFPRLLLCLWSGLLLIQAGSQATMSGQIGEG